MNPRFQPELVNQLLADRQAAASKRRIRRSVRAARG